jgi:DNA-binding CsgD family transcriptional regulator
VLKDTLNAISQREKLTELQIQYDLEQSDLEILQLKADQKNHNTIIALLVLLIVFTTIIVGLVIRKQKSRIRISEASKQHLQEVIQTKNSIEQDLKNELEFRTKELTSFALNMVQKKEMLETVRASLEEIKSTIDGEPKLKLNKILTTINFSQRLDRDWENFKLYFEQVHHGFFDNLSANYPELNSNDLRLCALIRLNLDTKQIASVMDIAPESAKVAKHRIRKKLGLANTENLNLFFLNLSGPVK